MSFTDCDGLKDGGGDGYGLCTQAAVVVVVDGTVGAEDAAEATRVFGDALLMAMVPRGRRLGDDMEVFMVWSWRCIGIAMDVRREPKKFAPADFVYQILEVLRKKKSYLLSYVYVLNYVLSWVLRTSN